MESGNNVGELESGGWMVWVRCVSDSASRGDLHENLPDGYRRWI